MLFKAKRIEAEGGVFNINLKCDQRSPVLLGGAKGFKLDYESSF